MKQKKIKNFLNWALAATLVLSPTAKIRAIADSSAKNRDEETTNQKESNKELSDKDDFEVIEFDPDDDFKVGEKLSLDDGRHAIIRYIDRSGDLPRFYVDFLSGKDIEIDGKIENKFLDPDSKISSDLVSNSNHIDSAAGTKLDVHHTIPNTKSLSDEDLNKYYTSSGHEGEPSKREKKQLEIAAYNSEVAFFHNYTNKLKEEALRDSDNLLAETGAVSNLNFEAPVPPSYQNESSWPSQPQPRPLQTRDDKDPNATVPYRSSHKDELETVRNQLNQISPISPQQVVGKKVGLAALKGSDESFASGDSESGGFLLDLAKAGLDLATDLIPVTSLPKDLYKTVEGKDPLTGEELSDLERGFAVAGVLTLGFSNELKVAGKAGVESLKIVAKGLGASAKFKKLLASTVRVLKSIGKAEREIEIVENGAKEAGRVIDAAVEAGDQWSRLPKSLQDQMVLDVAKSGKGGKHLEKIVLKDPRYKGMEKWEYLEKSNNGKDTVVHWVRDPATGELKDFKFKKHSTD